ncbi:HNH endonuclease [Hafnia alvei]|uniref:HNH nuclease domain-containing protein n=1 Tax=Hafnia alvei ATCC 51873 TaxID=1002364 RepID=G9YA76_HAFAL|nr:HNH endonuclease [Hafnia alvei]EHM40206.1 hypothetical protein HMPREF0454_03497 [Hafnia alvei ATCC 51873]QQE45362.1 HNH endonuclease [Hafnia alvei]
MKPMTPSPKEDCIDHGMKGNIHGYHSTPFYYANGEKKYKGLHRVVCSKKYDLDIDGDWVTRHTCDNPRCVNPDHLLPGTHAENVKDRDSRGRQAKGDEHGDVRGEKCGRAKLKEHQVEEIKKRFHPRCHKNGARALAREFGVSHAAVSLIVNGINWSHLHGGVSSS